MYTTPQKPFMFEKNRLQHLQTYVFFVLPLFFFACATTLPQEEQVSDYYWQIQRLKKQANDAALSTGAWRDLGLIYLKTGLFKEAELAFSRASTQSRTDSKIWFYKGLTQELLNRPAEALTQYREVPILSSETPYSQAIKGRVAWLEEKKLRESFKTNNSILTSGISNSFAVLPIECQGATNEYAGVGLGITEILSRNLDQLQDIDIVDPHSIRLAVNSIRTANQTRADLSFQDRRYIRHPAHHKQHLPNSAKQYYSC